MKLNVHSLKFDADQKLIDYIQKKADKLDRFFDRVVDGEVILKLNNEGVENKTVEIKINLPKNQLFSSEKSSTFEGATDKAIEGLRRQLKKYKEKMMAP